MPVPWLQEEILVNRNLERREEWGRRLTSMYSIEDVKLFQRTVDVGCFGVEPGDRKSVV